MSGSRLSPRLVGVKKLAVLAAAALLVTGCGGDGGDEGASPQPPAPATQPPPPGNAISELPPEEQFAYQEGLEQCSFYTIKDLAGMLGVPAKPDPIARAMARDEPNPKLREAIRRGCLDALKEIEKG